jgi:hypothetical protein
VTAHQWFAAEALAPTWRRIRTHLRPPAGRRSRFARDRRPRTPRNSEAKARRNMGFSDREIEGPRLGGYSLYTDMPLLDVPNAPAKLRILELTSVPFTLSGDHVQYRPFFGQALRRHRPVWFHENGSRGYADHDAICALSTRECRVHRDFEHEEAHQQTQLLLHDSHFL